MASPSEYYVILRIVVFKVVFGNIYFQAPFNIAEVFSGQGPLSYS